MPALTEDQRKLKEAALECKGRWSRAMSKFDDLANPAVILALLAQVEAAPAHPNWMWPKFEDWLASPITYPGNPVEYVRLAFNSGRLASPAVEQEPKP